MASPLQQKSAPAIYGMLRSFLSHMLSKKRILIFITFINQYIFFRSDPIYAVVDKTKKRNSRLIAEVENTTLEGNDNNKPNLQVYEAARCYSEPKNSKTHPSAASKEGAVLVLLPACLEESGTNSSARSLAGSGSEQRSSASSYTTSTSSV